MVISKNLSIRPDIEYYKKNLLIFFSHTFNTDGNYNSKQNLITRDANTTAQAGLRLCDRKKYLKIVVFD